MTGAPAHRAAAATAGDLLIDLCRVAEVAPEDLEMIRRWALGRADEIVAAMPTASAEPKPKPKPTPPVILEPANDLPVESPVPVPREVDVDAWPAEPFRIAFGTWRELASMWDAQLRHGAYLISTHQRLGPDDEVELVFVLPLYLIELRVAARVMQVMPGDPPGCAVKLVGVDEARLEGMRRFVEAGRRHAAGDGEVPDPAVLRVTALDDGSFRWNLTTAELLDLQDMRGEIARVANASPARILGLSIDAAPSRARERFFDLAQRWHPSRYAAPELREIAQAIFLAIERAYQSFLEAGERASSGAAPSSPVRRAVPTAKVVETPPVDAEADCREAEASKSGLFTGRPQSQSPKPAKRSTTVLTKRLMSRLGNHEVAKQRGHSTSSAGARRSSRTETAEVRPADPAPAGPAATSFERALSAATQRLQEKRYEEAAELFDTALRIQPGHARARVLGGFARARGAVAERRYDEALAAYDEVLRVDPNNDRAQKERVMIAALAQPGRR